MNYSRVIVEVLTANTKQKESHCICDHSIKGAMNVVWRLQAAWSLAHRLTVTNRWSQSRMTLLGQRVSATAFCWSLDERQTIWLFLDDMEKALCVSSDPCRLPEPITFIKLALGKSTTLVSDRCVWQLCGALGLALWRGATIGAKRTCIMSLGGLSLLIARVKLCASLSLGFLGGFPGWLRNVVRARLGEAKRVCPIFHLFSSSSLPLIALPIHFIPIAPAPCPTVEASS